MTYEDISVLKRDGSQELLNLEKIHKILMWACEDITGVSVSDIELKSQLKFFNGISTKEIHQTLIKTAADLISEDYPNYQYVASRLINFNLRKEVYGSINPWPLKKIVDRNVALNVYTKEMLNWYTEQEWSRLNKMIKHDRDYNFAYAGMKQMLGKYLIQNRVSKEYYETPQVAYLLIAATLFHDYPEDKRMKYIKDYYNAISNWDISVPTPIAAGVRSPKKQFSSCVLLSSDDSLDSISSTGSAVMKYAANRAGIGINAGRIRPAGSEIRGGDAIHTGITGFLKFFQAAMGSCSQGGIRKGSATIYYPFWHYEFDNLIVLKNNKGVEENRVRHMDYGIQLNRLAYKRLIDGGKITFFSPKEVPDLMDAFYRGDNDEFERLYEKYEKSRKVMKHSMPALEVFGTIIDERTSTGRVYIQNIDHCNTQSSFDQNIHHIEQSNLCCLSENQMVSTENGLQSVKKLYNSQEKLKVFDNESMIDMKTPMRLLRENEPVYRLYLTNGLTHDITADHKVRVLSGDYSEREWEWKKVENLKYNEKVCIQSRVGQYGQHNMVNEAFLLGLFHANGTKTDNKVYINLTNEDEHLCSEIEASVREVYRSQKVDLEKAIVPTFDNPMFTKNKRESGKTIGISKLNDLGFDKNMIPSWLWTGDEETVSKYLYGLFSSNSVKSENVEFLRKIQILLSNTGHSSKICEDNGDYWLKIVDNEKYGFVKKIEFISNQNVYCCEVDSEDHAFISNGIITKNCEITLPTKPFQSMDDEDGRIALCTLSAINWGNIKKIEDFEKPCEMAVRSLDALLSYQDFPLIQAKKSTEEFRTLGIGIINLAYFIAKNNKKYDDSAYEIIHDYMEAMAYYLTKASVELAKEKGPCKLSSETKYGNGIFPWEVRKKEVDNIIPNNLKMDWETLREDMKKYGIRNATLMALMPSETSSQLANATNGIEPPRALVSEKGSKDGVLKQVAPEILKLKNKYDLLWDQKSPDGYLNISLILQKFIDQAISTNVSINPENYENSKIPMKELIQQLLSYYKHGGKLLYYHNTYDGASDEVETNNEESESKKDESNIEVLGDENECDSCVL